MKLFRHIFRNIKNISGPVKQDLSIHLFSMIILGFVLFFYSKRISWMLLCLFSGVLIDLDHFVDYWFYFGFRWNFSAFFSRGYAASGRMFTFNHSWELIMLLAVLSLKYPRCREQWWSMCRIPVPCAPRE